MAEYESVIGLECHVELSTATKMFCGCRNEFGAPPNTNVCPVCLGHPGSLPVPNEKAIEYIVRIGLALDCRISPHSVFHRKNYFYPDMPKNFQISQYDLPICVDGHLDLEVDGTTRRVGITRVHQEEDTGKTSHGSVSGRIHEADSALVDYNRAGVPLVEVVSEPDIRTPEEAGAYLRELRSTLEALGVSDVRMEEGSLRCDANISTRSVGADAYGVKVEIKNLNSIRSLERALRFEESRQRAALDAGEALVQETRHWDEDGGATHTLRSKEEAFDYRYFPEPDLPPLEPDAAWVEEIRASLPELPAAKRSRYVRELGLKPEQALLLADTSAHAAFFEQTLALGADPRAAANWITQDLAGLANRAHVELPEARVTPAHVADLVRLVADGTVSATGAKQVLEVAFETGEPAEAIVEDRGLRQVTDTSALEAWVDEAIAGNPGPVEQFRGGKEGVLGFLVGQVMKRSGGSANPKVVNELLRERLSDG
ncbi:MAG TPA: Asp-tRNA(Asn)/Glu-tRNA(Gln) amidotransferase subunit GatB [Actinomycetota bacterium]|nr:Asp-tRNA(Asn)/Glu-tRNA(Gln) amidotransferase subunit GatB [Actinomycetota bacterium]